MAFLLRDILAKSCPWSEKCEFVSDRIRAIRQDLTAQHIITQEAVDILEKATRYYIVTAVQLCQEPMGKFDPVLHNTHTQECLKRLLFLYEFADQGYPNRPSFEACYLLYNLENPQVYYRLCQLPEKLRKANVMQLAISLAKAYLNRNFVHVFRILMQLPFLESAAFFRHIQPIRCQALEVMNTAYSSKNLSYPLSSLAKIFHFETKDIAIQFCSDHGIRISDEKVYFSKGQFMKPEKCVPLPCHVLIGSKLKDDLTDVLMFHKQSGWDENPEGKPDELLEAQVEVDQLAIVKKSSPVAGQVPTSMAGVCQEGLVSGQTGYMMGRGWGRGRGRARKKQPNIS